MYKNNLLKYNINNLDNKIFILLIKKYLYYFNLRKKLKINFSKHLILKYKNIINKLNTKNYND